LVLGEALMGEANVPWVVRNDWLALAPPPLGGWRPTSPVSVIIPAYNCQECLDLTLAGLSRQTYPGELLEVVVVDDGSEPKLELPGLAPPNARIVRAPDHSTGWGRANALHLGASASDGEIIQWLDADLVPFPEHVEAQARWHHAAPDVVTLGYKRFVREGWVTAAEVADPARPIETLFPASATEPHGYVEELIDATDQLRVADHLAFRAHVGATAALRRELYLAAGGVDAALRLGEDSELGYRLAQAGAVFVPEPRSRSWHLGPSHAMTAGDRQRRYNRPFLADRMPQPRWLRGGARRSWAVPLVTAVVEVAADDPLELVRECVDRLLASDEPDLRVLLVGDWQDLPDGRPAGRRPVLADPLLDRRLIAATYRSEPRVRLVDAAPETAFPSPYLLRVPVRLGVAPETVRRLVTEADASRVGLLRLLPLRTGDGLAPPAVELWRTAAVSRARRRQRAGQPLAEPVAALWGARWISGAGHGVVDLSARPAGGVSGRPGLRPAAARPVPVAGLRSLLRATGYVGRLAAARARRRLAGIIDR
jgi:glycosyltransferase involved in cell wall biosynthesis